MKKESSKQSSKKALRKTDVSSSALSMMDLSRAFEAGKRRAFYETRVTMIKAWFSKDTELPAEVMDYEDWAKKHYC